MYLLIDVYFSFQAVKVPPEKAVGGKENMELTRQRNATSLKERPDRSKTPVSRYVTVFVKKVV